MKIKNFLKVAIVSSLSVALLHNHAVSADTNPTSRCSSYGPIIQGVNPSFQFINCLLTEAALKADIPPEVVKAVSVAENGSWQQFYDNGEPFISTDGGIGIMQITNHPEYDQQKLKYDIQYNIEIGVKILSDMYDRTDLPKIQGANRKVIENWYFPVMAYNGIKPVNSPLKQETGVVNTGAYQEKVFAKIESNSLINDTNLAKFPFSRADFQYDSNSTQNIIFLKREYELTEPLHPTVYTLQAGDKVVVTEQGARLRLQPGPPANGYTLAENTILTVTGDFVFEQSTIENYFVWFPVQTVNGESGYISSAYITPLGDVPYPTIPVVDKQAPVISGLTQKEINMNTNFNLRAGVEAIDKVDGDVTKSLTVSNNLNIKVPGIYKITYTAKDFSGNVAKVIRTIKVRDHVKPVLKGGTDKTIKINSAFNKLSGVTAQDNVDGVITDKIKVTGTFNTKKKGTYTLVYTVADEAGNTVVLKRKITVK
jgi:hypothetical protein